MSEADIARERERYFVEARERAAALAERWRREPPVYNVPTGDAELDPLVWFRYVHGSGLDRLV
jgi:hypothetical protein